MIVTWAPCRYASIAAESPINRCDGVEMGFGDGGGDGGGEWVGDGGGDAVEIWLEM